MTFDDVLANNFNFRGSRAYARKKRFITQSLKELIASHPSIPMETIAKECNDYVQSLLTLKMNQATGIVSEHE